MGRGKCSKKQIFEFTQTKLFVLCSFCTINRKFYYSKKNCKKISKIFVRPNRKICIYYKDFGFDKPLLFFIHGSCARMGQFEEQIKFFESKKLFTILAYDQFGCGKSDKPKNWNAYSAKNLLQDCIS